MPSSPASEDPTSQYAFTGSHCEPSEAYVFTVFTPGYPPPIPEYESAAHVFTDLTSACDLVSRSEFFPYYTNTETGVGSRIVDYGGIYEDRSPLEHTTDQRLRLLAKCIPDTSPDQRTLLDDLRLLKDTMKSRHRPGYNEWWDQWIGLTMRLAELYESFPLQEEMENIDRFA